MVTSNDRLNDQRGLRGTQYHPVYLESFLSPPMHHQASTGQLNMVLYPISPQPNTQIKHSQWSQSPDIYPYWHVPTPTQDQNQNHTMLPPPSPTPPPTPTPSGSSLSAWRPYVKKLKVNQKLDVVFKAIVKDAHWTFSKFLYYAFQGKSSDGKKLCRNFVGKLMAFQGAEYVF